MHLKNDLLTLIIYVHTRKYNTRGTKIKVEHGLGQLSSKQSYLSTLLPQQLVERPPPIPLQ